eukprot:TRINITY_DN31114_c0_g4_i1.p2 TRINITY_DN31114_c0_g4~~TRINITY_DN31114_c0_g4_i1.p2  ORF type:complete len:116 (+),score=10.57 TRINITY_DN31114_c0_g4_i1:437-784(+)
MNGGGMQNIREFLRCKHDFFGGGGTANLQLYQRIIYHYVLTQDRTSSAQGFPFNISPFSIPSAAIAATYGFLLVQSVAFPRPITPQRPRTFSRYVTCLGTNGSSKLLGNFISARG